MEVINDLLNFKNLKIYQNNKWFNFSLDSVLLAKFVTINKKTKKIMDLGTGNAPIPLILSTRTKADIYGVEIQKNIYALAIKSVKINNLENQIKIICDNFINLKYNEFFDVVTCNPPYFEYLISSKINKQEEKTIARHEIYTSLEETIEIAKKILKNNGIFAIVHRADRLVEIIFLLKKHNLEPKRLQMIHPKKSKKANIILIEAKKNGKKGLKILSPIYVHNKNGEYKREIKAKFKE